MLPLLNLPPENHTVFAFGLGFGAAFLALSIIALRRQGRVPASYNKVVLCLAAASFVLIISSFSG